MLILFKCNNLNMSESTVLFSTAVVEKTWAPGNRCPHTWETKKTFKPCIDTQYKKTKTPT